MLNQVDINDPVMLADLAASMTNAKSEDLQKILETENLEQRIENTLLLLREEYDLSLLKEQISQKSMNVFPNSSVIFFYANNFVKSNKNWASNRTVKAWN